MKILIVDDSPTILRLLKVGLKQLGYKNVSEAADGLEALDILRKKKFDLLLTDWHMPKLSGLELTNLIRADEKLYDLPIIMITTESDKKSIVRALRSKINDYIVKPFTPETLRQRIIPILEKIQNDRDKKQRGPLKINVNIDNQFSTDASNAVFSFEVKNRDKTENAVFEFDLSEKRSEKIVINTRLLIDPVTLTISAEATDENGEIIDSNDIELGN